MVTALKAGRRLIAQRMAWEVETGTIPVGGREGPPRKGRFRTALSGDHRHWKVRNSLLSQRNLVALSLSLLIPEVETMMPTSQGCRENQNGWCLQPA